MRLLAIASLVVLLVGLLPDGGPSGGIAWDLLVAAGYMGLVLLAFLGWESEVPASRPRLRLHRNLALLATVLVVAHAIGFVLADPILIEYLLPTAPLYMLVGVVAGIGLLIVTTSSLPGPRSAVYGGFPRFRRWHRLLFGVVLGGAVWHTLGTRFTLAEDWQIGAIGVLTGIAPIVAYLARRADRPVTLTRPPAGVAAADAQTGVAVLLAIVFCLAWVAAKWSLCDTC
jgi:hypothetical protein